METDGCETSAKDPVYVPSPQIDHLRMTGVPRPPSAPQARVRLRSNCLEVMQDRERGKRVERRSDAGRGPTGRRRLANAEELVEEVPEPARRGRDQGIGRRPLHPTSRRAPSRPRRCRLPCSPARPARGLAPAWPRGPAQRAVHRAQRLPAPQYTRSSTVPTPCSCSSCSLPPPGRSYPARDRSQSPKHLPYTVSYPDHTRRHLQMQTPEMREARPCDRASLRCLGGISTPRQIVSRCYDAFVTVSLASALVSGLTV